MLNYPFKDTRLMTRVLCNLWFNLWLTSGWLRQKDFTISIAHVKVWVRTSLKHCWCSMPTQGVIKHLISIRWVSWAPLQSLLHWTIPSYCPWAEMTQEDCIKTNQVAMVIDFIIKHRTRISAKLLIWATCGITKALHSNVLAKITHRTHRGAWAPALFDLY